MHIYVYIYTTHTNPCIHMQRYAANIAVRAPRRQPRRLKSGMEKPARELAPPSAAAAKSGSPRRAIWQPTMCIGCQKVLFILCVCKVSQRGSPWRTIWHNVCV